MSRYSEMFNQLRARGDGALIPFFVLGYPDRERCLQVIDAAVNAGADALELGIPFSDPVADGPTIVAAGNQARAAGVSVNAALEMVGEIRRKHSAIPVGLLVYSNLVVSNGIISFMQRCKNVGVDSLLVTDMPLREADELRAIASDFGIEIVFILPPNASAQKAGEIAGASQGYVYLLSRYGVTGTEKTAGAPVEHLLEILESHSAAPGILGFGISTSEQVLQAMKKGAHGVVVGSAMVRQISEHPGREVEAIQRFVQSLKSATLRTDSCL